jgi:endonuclease III-like uncharacterized protein
MHNELFAAYGPQHWWPAPTPFEVILGACLTQNTSWKAVERSLANLRAAGALTVDGLRSLKLEELQRLIQPSGFLTRKAPALKKFIAMLDEEFAGSLQAFAATPTSALRARLLALPCVGPETADAILLYALGHPVPVADEYLRRIVERHQLLSPPPGRNRQRKPCTSFQRVSCPRRRRRQGSLPQNRSMRWLSPRLGSGQDAIPFFSQIAALKIALACRQAPDLLPHPAQNVTNSQG